MLIIEDTFENPFFNAYTKEKPANIRPFTEFMIHDVNPKTKQFPGCLNFFQI